MKKNQFVMDVMEIRKRARDHIQNGAVTSTYGSDRETVIKLLNEALATELVCTLRYKRHYYMAQGIHSQAIAQEFLEHANEEQQHADQLAGRIVQLGGAPDFNPVGIADRSHAEYKECSNTIEMLEENLVAERVAIDSYRMMINYIGGGDSTSRRVLEDILAVEEEHAEDLISLMQNIEAERKELEHLERKVS